MRFNPPLLKRPWFAMGFVAAMFLFVVAAVVQLIIFYALFIDQSIEIYDYSPFYNWLEFILAIAILIIAIACFVFACFKFWQMVKYGRDK